MKSVLMTAGVTIGFIVLTACTQQDTTAVEGITDIEEANWEVEPFEYIDHNNEPFGLEDLEDGYWIANFIFTRCPTVCNTMTPNMVNLQDAVLEEDIDVTFVSFTVDPNYDQPEVLREYASRYGVNADYWTFLTGYDDEEIQSFSEGSFRQEMRDDPEGNNIIHGVNFFLITDEHEIIRLYDGLNTPIEDVVADLQEIGL